ncbi:vezatin isoform X2 [Xenopus laevis]|uniref:Vezatin n=1 Tax=Xenopus laevis TaxID=8355 RepID=A0A8J0UWR5_XENLA|nr:vezatin isoform X2 [Xenopus laevis]
MTAEFDEEVVFENSPLFQYLQDLGQTDFEICPLLKEEERMAENGHGLRVHTTEKKSIISRTVELLKSWNPFFSKKKKDEKIHLLEIGFRLESLRTILQQEVLIQEDVELIELLDPGILSAGQTQNQQNGHLPTLWSIAAPNIWETSMLFAFLSALAALQSWSISSSLIWGPSFILFAAFTVLRALHTWRSARFRMILRKYCSQVEGTVANSRTFTNLVRKALRLIQETEVISRGFTLVSAACPYGKAGKHASQHLLGLRKTVYRTVRTNFRISRLATLYMLKHYPLNSEIDNVTNYICVVPLKDLGLGLCEEHVSEEDAHNLTDAFSLPALKVLFQLWIGQSSEFFRRLALLLSPENASPGPSISPEQLAHFIWSDVVQDLPHTQATCLAELKRSYEFYRYFETQHQSGLEHTAKRKKEVWELSNLHGAVRSLQLHLKSLLNEVMVLEDELEKLASCKEMQAMPQEASLMLEEKLRIIQPHVQASNTCWEDALCQVERMVRRPTAKKDTGKSSCENLNCPVVSNVHPALCIEDRDPVPEEQILEAYAEEALTDPEFNSEAIYLFSPEERERQKRERDESKRVLQELKAVLGLKASEAERQKWKQLLFSEHAVITPLLPEEPVGEFEPPPSIYPEDPYKNLGFYGEITSEINGIEHVKDAPIQGNLQMTMNYEDEAKICPVSEEVEPASGKEEGETPCPAPRTVLPPAIKERLARIHQSSDVNFTSRLAAQVAARSLTFTFLQEQTFGDEWDDDEDDDDQVNNVDGHEKGSSQLEE